MYNTPPCWAIYMCGLVFNHMLRNGGIKAMQKTNQAKAKVLYDAIDGSDGFYVTPIDKATRSSMNVPFTIPSSQELEAVFVKEAAATGMVSTLSLHAVVATASAELHMSGPRGLLLLLLRAAEAATHMHGLEPPSSLHKAPSSKVL